MKSSLRPRQEDILAFFQQTVSVTAEPRVADRPVSVAPHVRMYYHNKTVNHPFDNIRVIGYRVDSYNLVDKDTIMMITLSAEAPSINEFDSFMRWFFRNETGDAFRITDNSYNIMQ
jgi:hypothetical protein